MVHGHPDHGQSQSTKIVSPVSDLGELAARLGSINTFERSGNVFYQNRMDLSIIPFITTTTGTGAEIYADGSIGHHQVGSIRLIAGADAGANALIRKNLPIIEAGKMGYEIKFRPTQDAHEMHLYLRYYTGSKLIRGQIELDFDSQDLNFYNSSGVWEKISDLDDIASETQLWHSLKYVVDFDEKDFLRILLNDQKWTLTAEDLHESAAVEASKIVLWLGVLGKAGTNAAMNFNDMIITINEP